MGVFLEFGAAWVAAANVGAGTDVDVDVDVDVGAGVDANAGAGAGANANADAGACLAAPVLLAPDGSSHQTCVDAGLGAGSALLVEVGGH